MQYFQAPNSVQILRGKTLIFPVVSIGNVGQLAVDLLIESLNLSLVGALEDDAVLPCVGNEPYTASSPGQLATSLQLYSDKDNLFYVLQQRAPVINGRVGEFAANLATWVQNTGFSNLIILASLDAGKRRSHEMEGDQFHYVAVGKPKPDSGIETEELNPLKDRCRSLEWLPLEGADVATFEETVEPEIGDDDELEFEDGYPGPLTGGEWGQQNFEGPSIWKSNFWRIFCEFKEKKAVNIVALSLFSNEGDNIGDAVAMAGRLRDLLQPLFQSDADVAWRFPRSWGHLFGERPEVSLYG